MQCMRPVPSKMNSLAPCRHGHRVSVTLDERGHGTGSQTRDLERVELLERSEFTLTRAETDKDARHTEED